jgi:hypothetical protein
MQVNNGTNPKFQENWFPGEVEFGGLKNSGHLCLVVKYVCNHGFRQPEYACTVCRKYQESSQQKYYPEGLNIINT